MIPPNTRPFPNRRDSEFKKGIWEKIPDPIAHRTSTPPISPSDLSFGSCFLLNIIRIPNAIRIPNQAAANANTIMMMKQIDTRSPELESGQLSEEKFSNSSSARSSKMRYRLKLAEIIEKMIVMIRKILTSFKVVLIRFPISLPGVISRDDYLLIFG